MNNTVNPKSHKNSVKRIGAREKINSTLRSPQSEMYLFRRLFEKTFYGNIPLLATIELTRRCTLSCSHCYLPEARGGARYKQRAEMTTAEWEKALAELAGAGCLHLVFTGGEPLLRKDFTRLCRCARELAFDLRIFTTGHGLTDETAAVLADTGVSAVEMSVYGTEKTHDAITGVKGSFKTTMEAAGKISGNGVRVKLKSPILRENAGEIRFILELARRKGYECGFDPVLAPANDGNGDILRHRIHAEQLAAVLRDESISGPPTYGGLNDNCRDFNPAAPVCSAGRNVCGISPCGDVYPCLQIPVAAGSLRKKSFAEIWMNSSGLRKWRRAAFLDLKTCPGCGLKSVCNRCPGIAMLEDGDIMGPSQAACETAKIMKKAIEGEGRSEKAKESNSKQEKQLI